MTDQAPEKAPAAKQVPRPPAPDLSNEIERAVGREPADRVKCVRVFDDFYRCNWWSPAIGNVYRGPSYDFGVLSTHHVRKSRFLNVKANAGELQITEVKG